MDSFELSGRPHHVGRELGGDVKSGVRLGGSRAPARDSRSSDDSARAGLELAGESAARSSASV